MDANLSVMSENVNFCRFLGLFCYSRLKKLTNFKSEEESIVRNQTTYKFVIKSVPISSHFLKNRYRLEINVEEYINARCTCLAYLTIVAKRIYLFETRKKWFIRDWII